MAKSVTANRTDMRHFDKNLNLSIGSIKYIKEAFKHNKEM